MYIFFIIFHVKFTHLKLTKNRIVSFRKKGFHFFQFKFKFMLHVSCMSYVVVHILIHHIIINAESSNVKSICKIHQLIAFLLWNTRWWLTEFGGEIKQMWPRMWWTMCTKYILYR